MDVVIALNPDVLMLSVRISQPEGIIHQKAEMLL